MLLKQPILKKISQAPEQVWTPMDFYDLGNRALIDKTLQRLVRAHILRRIDRGLYDNPSLNLLTGQLRAPDYRAVIAAIARKDKARILLDGLTCANDLGLTNAVPGRITVLTDARIRSIVVENLSISFKLTSPKKLYWAGRPAMRIIQALYWLRDSLKEDKDIQKEVLTKIVSLLFHATEQENICMDLQNGLDTVPIWMQGLIKILLQQLHCIA